jgi:hypothetical protein
MSRSRTDDRERTITVNLEDLRARWHEVRQKRLQLKRELLSQGSTLAQVRGNRLFRSLKKEQRCYSVRIRHLERALNRMRSITRE